MSPSRPVLGYATDMIMVMIKYRVEVQPVYPIKIHIMYINYIKLNLKVDKLESEMVLNKLRDSTLTIWKGKLFQSLITLLEKKLDRYCSLV